MQIYFFTLNTELPSIKKKDPCIAIDLSRRKDYILLLKYIEPQLNIE